MANVGVGGAALVRWVLVSWMLQSFSAWSRYCNSSSSSSSNTRLALFAAAAAETSLYSSSCYQDTYGLAHNETFSTNRRFHLQCHEIPPYSNDCTSDYNNTALDRDFPTLCEEWLGGTVHTRDVHVYCSEETFHQFNYNFCLAASCANATADDIESIMEQVDFPDIKARTEENGWSKCIVSFNPRRRRLRWALMSLLAVACVTGVLFFVYYRRQRKTKLAEASS
jgi:hypothetical protein